MAAMASGPARLADHSEQAGLGEDLAVNLSMRVAVVGRGPTASSRRPEPGQRSRGSGAQVDGEGFAAVEHVGEALVRGVAAGEQRAGEQDDFAGLPCWMSSA